ncbi:MAG: DNA-binding response regulator [Gammaproteobacteria bacterium]|nr:DNA-binding response regulator [Gammaproteobacteria bacterium]MBJ56075.1 DNA-binding response regulator [Gammaproteobacteria bacterium]|tara:strand:+ start:5530 stop:6255 length:726 start_codon:yes stop_codon:yes gene_type:complete
MAAATAATTDGRARVRILLIDDHDLFREGLKYLLPVLDSKVQYFEAGTLDDALQLKCEEGFDLILLDYYMPGVNGMDALEKCRQTFESATLVVVSGEEDPRIIRQSIEQGASGYIPKSSSRDDLVEALRLVLAGGTYLPSHAYRPVSPAISFAVQQSDAGNEIMITKLSRRQFEVLMKAVQGKSNKTIARELDISDHTVKAHLSVAFRTLGVQNRTEAVYAAAKLGIQPGQSTRYEEVAQQ